MLKYLKTNKAQAVMGEYVLVLFVAVGMATAMAIYFKRAVQARVFDARNAMFNIVLTRTAGYYTDNLYGEYEPYYANTESSVARSEDTKTELLPGATTGIFRKTPDEVTAVQTRSETAPPKDAN